MIRSERPDAVALLEATAESAEALADDLGMQLVFGRGNSIFDLHIAWLSPLPIRRAHNHRLPALAKTLLEIELDGLRLFATHLASRHEERAHPRAAEVDAILGVLCGAERRHLLVGDLNALQPADELGTPPPGVTPHGDALLGAERLVLAPFHAAGYVDCYRALHPEEPGWTYPAPWLRLDYAFAPRTVAPRVSACEVVGGEAARSASDHRALCVTLEVGG